MGGGRVLCDSMDCIGKCVTATEMHWRVEIKGRIPDSPLMLTLSCKEPICEGLAAPSLPRLQLLVLPSVAGGADRTERGDIQVRLVVALVVAVVLLPCK